MTGLIEIVCVTLLNLSWNEEDDTEEASAE